MTNQNTTINVAGIGGEFVNDDSLRFAQVARMIGGVRKYRILVLGEGREKYIYDPKFKEYYAGAPWYGREAECDNEIEGFRAVKRIAERREQAIAKTDCEKIGRVFQAARAHIRDFYIPMLDRAAMHGLTSSSMNLAIRKRDAAYGILERIQFDIVEMVLKEYDEAS